MATYDKNKLLPQRKEALERWSQHIEFLSQDNVVPILLNKIVLTEAAASLNQHEQ